MWAGRRNIFSFIINIYSLRRKILMKNCINSEKGNKIWLIDWAELIDRWETSIKNLEKTIKILSLKLMKKMKSWKLKFKLQRKIFNNIFFNNRKKKNLVRKQEEWEWVETRLLMQPMSKIKINKLRRNLLKEFRKIRLKKIAFQHWILSQETIQKSRNLLWKRRWKKLKK